MDFEKTLKTGIPVLLWALLAIWLANNVREIGNLVRPRAVSGS